MNSKAIHLTVSRPSVDPLNYEYGKQCEAALEPWVDSVLEDARQAGWELDRAAYALMVLGSRKFNDLVAAKKGGKQG